MRIAISRLFPALSHVILPKGILDLEKKILRSDIHLLSPTVNLIARDSLHPAFIYLLLEAAGEIHGSSGWLQRAGEFPSPKPQDITVDGHEPAAVPKMVAYERSEAVDAHGAFECSDRGLPGRL